MFDEQWTTKATYLGRVTLTKNVSQEHSTRVLNKKENEPRIKTQLAFKLSQCKTCYEFPKNDLETN